MSPFMSRDMALEHMANVSREAAKARAREGKSAAAEGRVTVRRFQERDIDAIRRVANLDGKRIPKGAVLGAELGGELAARAVRTGLARARRLMVRSR
jgi:hypothetical protein